MLAYVANGVTIVHSKQRPQILDEVEKLLLIWIIEKELDGDSISEGLICEKALHIYADLLKETPSTSAESESGLLSKPVAAGSKNRSGIHCFSMHVEAAS